MRRATARSGIDRCGHLQALALEKQGLDVSDCQGEILAVRAIKTAEEVKCLQVSMTGAEAAVAAVRDAIQPGISENELFAIMYHEVIRQGGEFIETRLLTSGQRTNPWFSEASGRQVCAPANSWRSTPTRSAASAIIPISRAPSAVVRAKPTAYQKIALPHVL